MFKNITHNPFIAKDVSDTKCKKKNMMGNKRGSTVSNVCAQTLRNRSNLFIFPRKTRLFISRIKRTRAEGKASVWLVRLNPGKFLPFKKQITIILKIKYKLANSQVWRPSFRCFLNLIHNSQKFRWCLFLFFKETVFSSLTLKLRYSTHILYLLVSGK